MTFHCFWNLDLVRKASLPQASHPHISLVLLTALFHCRLLNFIWTLERFSLFMASYLLLVSFGLLSLVSFLWSLFTGLSLVAFSPFSPLESLQPPLHALRETMASSPGCLTQATCEQFEQMRDLSSTLSNIARLAEDPIRSEFGVW